MSNIHNNLTFNRSSQQQEKKDVTKKTLRQLVNSPNPVLLKISTVFPFTIFPDLIKIDRRKLSLVHTDFFWTQRVYSLNHKDILRTSVESGPFFATLVVTSRFFAQQPLKIKYLWKDQALLARRIIHGLMIVANKQITIKETDKNKIIAMLEKIGKTG